MEISHSYYTPKLREYMDILKSYIELIENSRNLVGAQSEAFLSVKEYFGRVRRSQSYVEMREFVRGIKNLGDIDFRVSSKGKISVIKVRTRGKPQKTQPERIFGQKNPGKHSSWQASDGILKFANEKIFIPIAEKCIPQISEVITLAEPLDFYSASAEYFVKLREGGFGVARPVLLPKEERRMTVIGARNPLLINAGNNDGKVVPNDIIYDSNNNIFVITGPNNGGKTTYVKTVGLVQLMGQAGLFVPAESAEISFTDGIYTHFVAPDDITEGEGRYRNELRRMKEIFEAATPFSLVIVDEPCGGTGYEEGQRQSLTLLDGFHRLGSATYFTTHMHPLTREIGNGRFPAGKNLQVECIEKSQGIQYTYRVIPGSSGKSYGEEIAREVGLENRDIRRIISKRAKKEGYGGLLR